MWGLFSRRDKSITMSVPKSYTLHGVTIRKLPIVKYIAVMREVNDLPSLLLGELIPDGKSVVDVIANLQKFDKNTVLVIIGRLFKVVPEELCRILSQLLDIPEERLLDPQCTNSLSLSELAEIIEAFWKINDMSDFLTTVQSLMKQAAPTRSKANTGFKDGSQSPKASE